ncbi:MAG: hypothetical protein Kow00127_01260 [Bacteroidales bacterium]
MKSFSITFRIIFWLSGVFILLTSACTTPAIKDTTGFDPELKKETGADEYGMKRYVMAFLYRGDSTLDSAFRIELQRQHLDNIGRMAEEGKLVLAGPFLDSTPLRGIYIFNTESIDEARQWTQTDPAIRAGSLKMELHPWYGSAALVKVNELHKRLSEKAI